MINIQPIIDADLYTLGTWTSQLVYNANGKFPTGTTGEWGYLMWTETNTGTGYTGQVRIDILDSSDTVIIEDIAMNTDGTPTDLSTTDAANSDIKIKIKLYGLDAPTPIVSNLKLLYKNWNQVNVVTNNGKNVLLNRTLSASPTTEPISQMRFGNGETTLFTENSTGLTNGLGSWVAPDSTSIETDYNTISLIYELTNSDLVIPNGTTINALGFQNQDATPLFCAGTIFSNITKNPAYYYKATAKFRILNTATSRYTLTNDGRNIFIDRTFNEPPTYTAPTNFVLGYTGALSDSLTALDSELVGPTALISSFDTAATTSNQRAFMNSATGNGDTFNAVGHYNTDGTPVLTYVSKTYSDILKTSSYIYQFDTMYRSRTPTSSTG